MWHLYYPYAYYQLILSYLAVGVLKFTDMYQQDAFQKFPTLPQSFWPICGLWEIHIAILLLLGLEYLALCMNFIFLGGCFYAVFWILDTSGTTSARKTFGLSAIPVRPDILFSFIITPFPIRRAQIGLQEWRSLVTKNMRSCRTISLLPWE
jgi:hypothetical protein